MSSAPRLRAATRDLLWLREPSSIAQYLRTSRRLGRRITAGDKRAPVLVFQPGKVGSRSVYWMLAARRWPVLHTHHATHAWLKKAVDRRQPGATKRWAASRLPEIRFAQTSVLRRRSSVVCGMVKFAENLRYRPLSWRYWRSIGVGSKSRPRSSFRARGRQRSIASVFRSSTSMAPNERIWKPSRRSSSAAKMSIPSASPAASSRSYQEGRVPSK